MRRIVDGTWRGGADGATEGTARPLSRGAVDPDAGHAPEPPLGLRGQVRVAGEAAAVGEALAHVADGALDVPLRVRPVGPAGPGPKALVRVEAEELGVLGDAAVLAPQIPDDHALHLVEQELPRHASEEAEGRLQTLEQRRHVLPRVEPEPQQPRVAEHDQKQVAAAPREAEVGEVHLALHSRVRLEPHERVGPEHGAGPSGRTPSAA